MVILPPVERFASCHTFPTALGSNIKSAGQRFPITYANLVVHAGGESQVSVNGIPVPDTAFHPLPGTVYLTATVEFPPGVQNIGTSDMRGVGVMVYAFEFHDAFSFIPGYVSGPLTTGITDAPIPDRLTLEAYPNPATDHVLATVQGVTPGEGSLIVYDALGRQRTLVHRGAFQPGQTQFGINVQSYPPGIYYLVLQRQDARRSLRFTVMR